MINATNLRTDLSTKARWLAVDAREPIDLAGAQIKLDKFRRDFSDALLLSDPKQRAHALGLLHGQVKSDLHRGHSIQGRAMTPHEIDHLTVQGQPLHPVLREFIKHQFNQTIENGLREDAIESLELDTKAGKVPSSYDMDSNLELESPHSFLIYAAIRVGRNEALEPDPALRTIRGVKAVIRVCLDPDLLKELKLGSQINLHYLEPDHVKALNQALKIEFVSHEHFHDVEFLSEAEIAAIMEAVARKILAGEPVLPIEEAQVKRLLLNNDDRKLSPVERVLLANHSLEEAKRLDDAGIVKILEQRHLHDWLDYLAQKYRSDPLVSTRMEQYRVILTDVKSAASSQPQDARCVAKLLSESSAATIAVLSSLDADSLGSILKCRAKGLRPLMDVMTPQQSFELAKLSPTAAVEFLRRHQSRFRSRLFNGDQLRSLLKCHPSLKNNPEFVLPSSTSLWGRFKNFVKNIFNRNYRHEAGGDRVFDQTPVPTLGTLVVEKAKLQKTQEQLSQVKDSILERVNHPATTEDPIKKAFVDGANQSAKDAAMPKHEELANKTAEFADKIAGVEERIECEEAKRDLNLRRQVQQEILTLTSDIEKTLAVAKETAHQTEEALYLPTLVAKERSPEVAFLTTMSDPCFDYLAQHETEQLMLGLLFNEKVQNAFKALAPAKLSELLSTIQANPDVSKELKGWLFETPFIRECRAQSAEPDNIEAVNPSYETLLKMLTEGDFTTAIQTLKSDNKTIELLKALMSNPDLKSNLLKTGRYYPVINQIVKTASDDAEAHAWFIYLVYDYQQNPDTQILDGIQNLLALPHLREQLKDNLVQISRAMFVKKARKFVELSSEHVKFLLDNIDCVPASEWLKELQGLNLNQLERIDEDYPNLINVPEFCNLLSDKCFDALVDTHSIDAEDGGPEQIGVSSFDLRTCFGIVEKYFQHFKARFYECVGTPIQIALKQLSDTTLLTVLDDFAQDQVHLNNRERVRNALLSKLTKDGYWRCLAINSGKAEALVALISAHPQLSPVKVEKLLSVLRHSTVVSSEHLEDKEKLIQACQDMVQEVDALEPVFETTYKQVSGKPLKQVILTNPNLDDILTMSENQFLDILLMKPEMKHWHAWLADRSVMKKLLSGSYVRATIRQLAKNKLFAENFLRFAHSNNEKIMGVEKKRALDFLNDERELSFTLTAFKASKEAINLIIVARPDFNPAVLSQLANLPEFIESLLIHAIDSNSKELNNGILLFRDVVKRHAVLRQKIFEYVNRQYMIQPQDHTHAKLLLDSPEILRELITTDKVLESRTLAPAIRDLLGEKIQKSLPEFLALPGVDLVQVFKFMIPLLGTEKAFTDFLSKVLKVNVQALKDNADNLMTIFDRQHTVVFVDFCLANGIMFARHPNRVGQRKEDFEPRLRHHFILRNPDLFNFNSKADKRYLADTLKQMTYRKGMALALGLSTHPIAAAREQATRYTDKMLKRFIPSRWKRNVLTESLLDDFFVDSPVALFKKLRLTHQALLPIVLNRATATQLLDLATALNTPADHEAFGDLFNADLYEGVFVSKLRDQASCKDLIRFIGNDTTLYNRVLEIRPDFSKQLIDTLDAETLLDFANLHPAFLTELLLEVRGQKALRPAGVLIAKLLTQASPERLVKIENIMRAHNHWSEPEQEWFNDRVREVFSTSSNVNEWEAHPGLVAHIFERNPSPEYVGKWRKNQKDFLIGHYCLAHPEVQRTPEWSQWIEANATDLQKLALKQPLDMAEFTSKFVEHLQSGQSLPAVLDKPELISHMLKDPQYGDVALKETVAFLERDPYQANILQTVFLQNEFWTAFLQDGYSDLRARLLTVFQSHGIWGHPDHELVFKQTSLKIDANMHAYLCRLLLAQQSKFVSAFLEVNAAFRNARAIFAERNSVLDEMPDANKSKLYKFASRHGMGGLFDYMEDNHKEACQSPLECIHIMKLIQKLPEENSILRILNSPDFRKKLFSLEGFCSDDTGHIALLHALINNKHFPLWLFKQTDGEATAFIQQLKEYSEAFKDGPVAKLVDEYYHRSPRVRDLQQHFLMGSDRVGRENSAPVLLLQQSPSKATQSTTEEKQAVDIKQ